MAENTEPVEEQQPTTPKAMTFGEFKKNTKIYEAEAVETLVETVETRAIEREQVVEAKIEKHRVDTEVAITEVQQNFEQQIVAAKTEISKEIETKTGEGGIHYMGILETLNDLKAITDAKHGQFYIVKDVNKTFIWTVPKPTADEPTPTGNWEEMSASVDLSNYYTKDQVYSKDEVDIIRQRAANNELKLKAIIAAAKACKDIVPLVDEEYTMNQIMTITNTFLTVMKTIGDLASA